MLFYLIHSGFFFRSLKASPRRALPLHYHLNLWGLKTPVIVASAYALSGILDLFGGYVGLSSAWRAEPYDQGRILPSVKTCVPDFSWNCGIRSSVMPLSYWLSTNFIISGWSPLLLIFGSQPCSQSVLSSNLSFSLLWVGIWGFVVALRWMELHPVQAELSYHPKR